LIDDGVPADDIAVICAAQSYRRPVRDELQRAGIAWSGGAVEKLLGSVAGQVLRHLVDGIVGEWDRPNVFRLLSVAPMYPIGDLGAPRRVGQWTIRSRPCREAAAARRSRSGSRRSAGARGAPRRPRRGAGCARRPRRPSRSAGRTGRMASSHRADASGDERRPLGARPRLARRLGRPDGHRRDLGSSHNAGTAAAIGRAVPDSRRRPFSTRAPLPLAPSA